MTRRSAFVLGLGLWVGLGLSANGAAAADLYYVMIFGSQPHPKQLRYSHTWATFLKASGEGCDANAYAIEAHTISWMPASLDVKVFSPQPEPGVNLDLDQTLAMAASHAENVTMWGPFRIGPEVYDRSLRVHEKLSNGAVRYRAIDGANNVFISDCIHAVAAVDPQFGRNHYPLIRIGNSASRYIARQLMARSLYDQSRSDNAWLIARFGLEQRGVRIVPPSHLAR